MLEREGVRVLLKEVEKVGNGILGLLYGMLEVRGARIHQEKPIYLGKYGPTIFGLLVHRKAIAGLQALTKAADITIHFQVNEMPSEWHGMVTMA